MTVLTAREIIGMANKISKNIDISDVPSDILVCEIDNFSPLSVEGMVLTIILIDAIFIQSGTKRQLTDLIAKDEADGNASWKGGLRKSYINRFGKKLGEILFARAHPYWTYREFSDEIPDSFFNTKYTLASSAYGEMKTIRRRIMSDKFKTLDQVTTSPICMAAHCFGTMKLGSRVNRKDKYLVGHAFCDYIGVLGQIVYLLMNPIPNRRGPIIKGDS